MQIQSITRPDNRQLSYVAYGKADGVPVFRCHGTPASHLVSTLESNLADEVGIRLIVPDRPGYGYSDFQPDRTLLDWPDDVVAIADHLGIEQFGIMGFSGGGPHALACAYKIPDRLTKVAIVSGLGPVVELGEERTPMTAERRQFKLEQINADPEAWLANFVSNVSGPDGERIKADARHMLEQRLMASRQGVEGAVYDETLILTKAWGFALADIEAEVHLWQGEVDANVQFNHGKYISEHIPNCTAHFITGAGHLMPPEIMKHVYELFVDGS